LLLVSFSSAGMAGPSRIRETSVEDMYSVEKTHIETPKLVKYRDGPGGLCKYQLQACEDRH